MGFYMEGLYWDFCEGILSKYDFFNKFRAGGLSKVKYREEMVKHRTEILDAGIDESNFNRLLVSVSGNAEVIDMLQEFRDQGGFSGLDYGEEDFFAFSAKIKHDFYYGGYLTFIFPEDELFMYAAAKLTAPKTMFVAGSFFGYWVIWAMDAIKENGGICTLSDINPDAMRVAGINMKKFGYENNVRLVADDAEQLLLSSDEKIDLLVLDATGSYTAVNEAHRGKALYSTLLSAARHRLYKGSIILVHNLERDLPDLAPLIKQLDEISSAKAELVTLNGLGIYKVRC
jgi:predicted O-methyltransferase YrrM